MKMPNKFSAPSGRRPTLRMLDGGIVQNGSSFSQAAPTLAAATAPQPPAASAAPTVSPHEQFMGSVARTSEALKGQMAARTALDQSGGGGGMGIAVPGAPPTAAAPAAAPAPVPTSAMAAKPLAAQPANNFYTPGGADDPKRGGVMAPAAPKASGYFAAPSNPVATLDGFAGLYTPRLRDGGPVMPDAEHGGKVPGKGRGDKIHAMLEPGEIVISNKMRENMPGLREEMASLREHTLAQQGMTVAEADAKARSSKDGTLRAQTGDVPKWFEEAMPKNEKAWGQGGRMGPDPRNFPAGETMYVDRAGTTSSDPNMKFYEERAAAQERAAKAAQPKYQLRTQPQAPNFTMPESGPLPEAEVPRNPKNMQVTKYVPPAAAPVRTAADVTDVTAKGSRFGRIAERTGNLLGRAAASPTGRLAGKAAGASAVLQNFNDYKIDDPDVDSSAAGTFDALTAGDFAGAGRSASKGALEAGMDLGSFAANTADIFVPGQGPSQAYNKFLRDQFGDQLADKSGNAAPGTAAAKTGPAPYAPSAAAFNPNARVLRQGVGPNADSAGMEVTTTPDGRQYFANQAVTNADHLEGMRLATQAFGAKGGDPTGGDRNLLRLNKDGATRELANASWAKRGMGVRVDQGPNGPMFSNSTGPEKMQYVGRDGKPTSEYRNTQQYAEGIHFAQKTREAADRMERDRLVMESGSANQAYSKPAQLRLAEMDKIEKNGIEREKLQAEKDVRLGTAQSNARAAQLDQENKNRQFAFDVEKFGEDRAKNLLAQRGESQKQVSDQIAAMLPPGPDGKPDTANAARHASSLNAHVSQRINQLEQHLSLKPNDKQALGELQTLRERNVAAMGPDAIRKFIVGMQASDLAQKTATGPLVPWGTSAKNSTAPIKSLRREEALFGHDYVTDRGDTIAGRHIDGGWFGSPDQNLRELIIK